MTEKNPIEKSSQRKRLTLQSDISGFQVIPGTKIFSYLGFNVAFKGLKIKRKIPITYNAIMASSLRLVQARSMMLYQAGN
jgi:hypothetical protein